MPRTNGATNQPIRVQLKNAPTANVLSMLCAFHNCEWDFDAVRGLRVTPKRRGR